MKMIDINKELGITSIDFNNIDINNNTEDNIDDFFKETLDDLDKFDEKAWKKGDGLIFPNYPVFTEKLEGIDAGLYLFAGLSNSGKSAIMMNLLNDCCMYKENNVFGLYISLDDSNDEIIARLIAMEEKIPIGIASKPQRYKNKLENAKLNEYYSEEYDLIEKQLKKREDGLEKLRKNNDKLKVIDTKKVTNIDEIYNYIKQILVYLKAKDPNKKLIIAIDSINDIVYNHRLKEGESVSSEIAKTVKSWTVEFDCPIFASTHMRKINANRRPVLDDLKDSTVLVYEASVTFIVYNDVSANKNNAKIFQQRLDSDEKEPILEIDWAKNKKSSYKGRTFCYFKPDYSKTLECNAEDMKRYSALIYEA